MPYIEKSWWGRVRLMQHESGDLGPRVTFTRKPTSIIKAFAALKAAEDKAKSRQHRNTAKNG